MDSPNRSDNVVTFVAACLVIAVVCIFYAACKAW
jgi:hypothetical protein